MNVDLSSAIPCKSQKPQKNIPAFLLSPIFEVLISSLSAFFLAGISIFDNYAPLGIAFVSASAKKHCIFPALGAILGYIVFQGQIEGLKYSAAIILYITAFLMFRSTPLTSHKIFSPILTVLSLVGVGTVFTLYQGATLKSVVLFICELSLVACTAWFYEDGFDYIADKQLLVNKSLGKISFFVLLLSVLCCFCQVTIGGLVSIVRTLLSVFMMNYTFKNGVAKSTTAALVIGLVMDARNGGIPFFSIVYAVCAIISGLFACKGKLLFILSYIASGASACIWTSSSNMQLAFICEGLIASAVFMFFPHTPKPHTLPATEFSAALEGSSYSIQKALAKRVSSVSNAFSGIYSTLTSKIKDEQFKNTENPRIIFDYAANKTCKNCPRCGSCWENGYASTVSAMNSVSKKLLDSGHLEIGDFPSYFSDKCLKPEAFAAAVNDGARELISRRKYKQAAQKTDSLIYKQYSEIAELLKSMSSDIEKFPKRCPLEEVIVQNILKRYQGSYTISVTKAASEKMLIEIKGPSLKRLYNRIEALKNSLRRELCRSFEVVSRDFENGNEILTLAEAEKLSVSIGVGVSKKEGENVSGDNGIYFKNDDGNAYMLLSDGMGTGSGAAAESKTSIALLENLLRAGIDTKEAIKIVFPIFAMRDESGGGFATLDILKLNLFSGECQILKYGAVQSYIKTDGSITRIDCTTLPPGVCTDTPDPDIADTTLKAGDTVVMLSDGITGEFNDSWLTEQIKSFDGTDPKLLAGDILNHALSLSHGSDDMTVIVLSISNKV